jgi:hypothetical protein
MALWTKMCLPPSGRCGNRAEFAVRAVSYSRGETLSMSCCTEHVGETVHHLIPQSDERQVFVRREMSY